MGKGRIRKFITNLPIWAEHRVSWGEYIGAVWRHWLGLAWFFVAGLLGAVTYFEPGLRVPSWGWWLLALIGLIVSQFLAFHDLRVERDQRKPSSEVVEAVTTRLNVLTYMRHTFFHDKPPAAQMSSEISKWYNETFNQLGELAPTYQADLQAAMFSTPPAGEYVSSGLDADQQKAVQRVDQLIPAMREILKQLRADAR